MRQLLVLGGGSTRNIEWGESCIAHFGKSFDMVEFMHYSHWETGEENINFDREIEKLKDVISNMGEGDLYVFAKSIGTILTLKAVAEDVINPVKCVFFGMPFSLVESSVFHGDYTSVSDFSVSSIAFHNLDDPLALFNATKKVIDEHLDSIRLLSAEGDNHSYRNFEDFTDVIHSFLRRI